MLKKFTVTQMAGIALAGAGAYYLYTTRFALKNTVSVLIKLVGIMRSGNTKIIYVKGPRLNTAMDKTRGLGGSPQDVMTGNQRAMENKEEAARREREKKQQQ